MYVYYITNYLLHVRPSASAASVKQLLWKHAHLQSKSFRSSVPCRKEYGILGLAPLRHKGKRQGLHPKGSAPEGQRDSESMKHAWLPCPRPHPGTRWHLAVGSRPRTSEIQFQSAEQPMLQETSLLQAAHCRLPALCKVDEPVPPEALCLPGLCCAAMTRDKRSIGMPSWLQKCLVCPLKASTACKQRSERSERLLRQFLRGRIG